MVETTFNIEYIITVVLALLSAYLVQKGSPNASPFIVYFLVPLLVAYISLQIINAVFPALNVFGQEVKFYVSQKTLGQLNSMGYMQIFPPLFAVLILFFVLLYNRNLG